jgi:hypothetical protein
MAMTPQEQVELVQRARLAEINSHPEGRALLEKQYGQVWDTDDLRRDFEVLQFAAPWLVVKRRADGVTGTLEFQHSPRFYWGFREDRGQ